MDKRIFWVIIEATLEQSSGETAIQESLIKDQLHNFDLKDLIGFQANCLEFMNGLYSSEIWAAEYVLLNSCSEDSFTELRIGTEEHKYWLGNKGRYWFEYHQSMFISTIHQVLRHHGIPYLTMNNLGKFGVFECIDSLRPLIDWDKHMYRDSDLTSRLQRGHDFAFDNEHPNIDGHKKISKCDGLLKYHIIIK